MRSERLPEDWPIRVIQLLAVPGMMVAFYLLLFHNGNLVNACTASGWDDCGQVSGPDAPYSSIGPIPVALIGLAGYVAIFLVAWSANPSLDHALMRRLLRREQARLDRG